MDVRRFTRVNITLDETEQFVIEVRPNTPRNKNKYAMKVVRLEFSYDPDDREDSDGTHFTATGPGVTVATGALLHISRTEYISIDQIPLPVRNKIEQVAINN